MAASNSNVATMTESVCRVETARGSHRFTVAEYSLHRGIGVGRFIRSTTFAVGGYDWCLRFYPDGDQPAENPAGCCVAFCLELVSGHTQARASAEFTLVDMTNGLRRYFRDLVPRVFSTMDNDGLLEPSRGMIQVMTRSEFEASPYLHNNCLVIECSVIVIRGSRVVEDAMPAAFHNAQVTPSDLSCSLGKMLEGKKGVDVTFKVKDEVFPAHKIVLAMRSPVFDAQFFGPMANSTSHCITIEDMQPDVFRALLHFIYTDSLPAMNDADANDKYEIVKHLIVAADKYGIERLKLTCESVLCMSLIDVENVATTLALADQHSCSNLKQACINFIASSNRTDDVMGSQGYLHLKRACPTTLVDTWEKVVKYREDKNAYP